MRTTVAVSVTFKVEAEGTTAEALIANAVRQALEMAEAGTHQFFTVATVEGATPLVNRPALELAVNHYERYGA